MIGSHSEFDDWCRDHGGEYEFQEIDESSMCVFGDQEWVSYGDLYLAEGNHEVRVVTNPKEQTYWWGEPVDVDGKIENKTDTEIEGEDIVFHGTGERGLIVGSGDQDIIDVWTVETALDELGDWRGYRTDERGEHHRPVGGAPLVPREIEESDELVREDGVWITDSLR